MTRKQKPFASKMHVSIAESLSFIHTTGKGSHRVFKRASEVMQLNFQNRKGFIPQYQARQLLIMIEKNGEYNE